MIVAEKPLIANLQVLFQPGDTVELRCVGHRTISGFYRDFSKLAQDAAALNTDFNPKENVYVCLNAAQPDLYARSADKFGYAERGGAVKDNQVVCRRWLLIDIDPVRPSGVSATDQQKQAAGSLAQQVYAWLVDLMGKDCLVCADSGNGSHILIRLDDVPADDQTRWVCERFLQLLDQKFSTDDAKIDCTTFNAARICTLYGTIKRKGSDIPEQPHRPSKLVHAPDPLQPAEWATLSSLVDPYAGKQQPAPSGNGQAMLDIPQLLQQRGLEYSQDDQYQTQSGETATRFVLEICPFNPEHTDRSAAITQWPSNGAVAFKCHHDGCSGKDWSALQQLWQLPANSNGITAEDIVFSVPQTSLNSLSSLESYIDPPVIDPTAFYGPLGEIVLGIEQHTEASPISILCGTLAYFGNAMGRKYYLQLDQAHYPKLYVALVGTTGTGRKGTADVQARRIVDAIDPLWVKYRHNGLSTGEGMLQVLEENSDGIVPRPAVFTEREFAAVLKRADRRGNTLNTFIRDAWDNETLSNSIKSDPIRIDDHHIGINAHITPAELKRLLTNDDVSNGFSNRFLWIYSQRTSRRPGAKGFFAADFQPQISRLQAAVQTLEDRFAAAGQQPIQVPFAAPAAKLWEEELYLQLDIDSDIDTILTLMCSRQAQQVCRIALCFALADGQQVIQIKHLQAACAISSYCWDTVDYMLSRDWWGDAGNAHDPAGMAPKVLQALQDQGPLTRTTISAEVFHRHRTAKEINALRDLLILRNQIQVGKSGRIETWKIR